MSVRPQLYGVIVHVQKQQVKFCIGSAVNRVNQLQYNGGNCIIRSYK